MGIDIVFSNAKNESGRIVALYRYLNKVYGNGVNKGNRIIYVYISFKIIVDNSI